MTELERFAKYVLEVMERAEELQGGVMTELRRLIALFKTERGDRVTDDEIGDIVDRVESLRVDIGEHWTQPDEISQALRSRAD